MSTWDEDMPHPNSDDGKDWRERCQRAGKPDPYGAYHDTPGVVIAVAYEIAELAHGGLGTCSVYFGNSGGDAYPALVTIEDELLVRIAEDGTTSSIVIHAADWRPFTCGEQER